MNIVNEVAAEIRRKMIERFMQEIAKILNKDEYEIQPNQDNEIEFSCEDVLKIYGKVYWIIGDENIKKVKPYERYLKHPPIYFRDGECKELLRRMGLGKGIYLVKNGIVLGSVPLRELTSRESAS